ncbi:hypothetical protein [Rhodalgimonas zhirmunskyi]|uniref:Uncharacterized protein n=1 Tax=Rhodalgimonas zhirmunskyi TaxID=2964767 RepID=A0AAJ1U9G0_9RHOB|nr:hypothetical protein [Rhodoalgimonas zhirmunskyi]MDQ2095761.1 hypothetical protein [Rhodoalgimonas zhirmunskyi]
MTSFGPAPLLPLIAALGLGLAAPSQADEATECQAALDGFSAMLGDGDRYLGLRSQSGGAALHGLPCHEGEIIDWFEKGGWTHRKTATASGAFFGAGSTRYRMDRGLVFCRPQPRLLGWLKGGCSVQATVVLSEGRITHVFAGPTK